MADEVLDKVLHNLDQNFTQSCERLFELMRFPSISTDSAYSADCRNTADWLVKELQLIGLDAKRHDTTGHPIVVANAQSAGENAPNILFYGHYDVQPVDPISLWKHDPFTPQIEERNGHKVIAGRGASDDKGQIMTFIEALRSFMKVKGELPINLTLLLEGEEESGSVSLPKFLKDNADNIKADCALICDTSMWNRDTPSITTSLRGTVGEEIIIKAANRDLHSGYYGGTAVNPLHVLTKILADLHDENGRITIPQFYDGVEKTDPAMLADWDKLELDEKRFLYPIGLEHSAGEKGWSLVEQAWARPTAEVNGITGGYQGEGLKTVIPAEASAKISFRLVHKQDPFKIRDNFRQFVQEHLPNDCTVEFKDHGAAPALNLSPSSKWVQLAKQALTDEWHVPAVLTGSGGSIPIASEMQSRLGVEPLFIGFALDDDQIHSPNEKYEMQSFYKGQRSWARIIEKLAQN